ncbi:MAG TPA: ParB/RepB/Spo0J family partition protein [Pseudolabrys sp.]
MQLQTVPLSSLLPPKGNPRRTLDTAIIAGLAQSIRADGLLQNLVVCPTEDDNYRVIAGKRRYLALQLLKKQGAIDGDYGVPVEIRSDLAEDDMLRLATVENVQREPLPPMEEAEAFAKLLQHGGSVEGISEKTGLSMQTVRRRVALAALCSDAKKALRTGEITLRIAEALTLGTPQQQRSVLEAIRAGEEAGPEDIRAMLVEQKPSVALAIFPREQYTGTITADLFADETTSYFDDVDQFLTLQRGAVEQLAEEHRQSASRVEVFELYSVPWWQYRETADGEPSGTVINLHPSGSVEVRTGLVRHEVQRQVGVETRETPISSRAERARAEFNVPLLQYVAHHKSGAVQAALLRNPRKAKEVAVLLLLSRGSGGVGVTLTPHPALEALAERHGPSQSYREIEAEAAALADRLGLPNGSNGSKGGDGIGRLLINSDSEDLFKAVRKLSDGELDRLLVLLPLLCLGQQGDRLDAGQSLFNQIAADLDIHMRDWWTPDLTFLNSLRREHLIAVAEDSGASLRFAGFKNWSKTELVQALARFFSSASAPDAAEDEATRQARTWQPGIFGFPASEDLRSTAQKP